MTGVPGSSGVSVATHYRCRECGRVEFRYYAQCVKCLKMGTLQSAPVPGMPVADPESMVTTLAPARSRRPTPTTVMLPPSPAPAEAPSLTRAPLVPLTLGAARLSITAAPSVATGIAELDRVLGGGLVAGSVVLLGGDPGSGKSTLLMQALYQLCQGSWNNGALYASAEENEQQIALRALRIGIRDEERISLVHSDDVDQIIALARSCARTALVVDSIQTMRTADLDSEAGSLTQVAECTARLARFAKSTQVPVFIIGQVTKDGAIAGPKRLEHLVDVVLYLETAGGSRRHLSAPNKNRFSSTGDVGVFEMREAGLASVENASSLTERAAGAPGSAVFPSVISERVQLVEIQALVGAPKSEERPRGSLAVTGVDAKRVQVIMAILARHAAIDVGDRDVFVSVTGGAKAADPAADLAIALAIASSYRDLPIDPTAACFGELGLTGEVRSVAYAYARADEARRAGFSLVLAAEVDASETRGEGAATISDAIAKIVGEAVQS